MKKCRMCVIGHFDRNNAFDGQTIKTIEIVDALCDRYGEKEVRQLSYHKIKEDKIKLFSSVFSAFVHSEIIIIIANTTSVPGLIRACTMINKLFRRDIHFILVGGALPQGIDENPSYLPVLQKLKAIYLETQTLINDLKQRGLERLYILPNFKTIRRYTADELPGAFVKPYKLVFMSRVSEEKGVAEMIGELEKINQNGVKYTLDIYGKVNAEYEDCFEKLKENLPEYIKYRGVANPGKTTEIMHDYFLHVLPTKCPTEGQPASVIDSFFAGLPILCGRWNSCADMVAEGITGVSFELGNFDDFREKLEYFYDHPEKINAMRVNCVKEAEKFMPQAAMKILFDRID